MADKIIKNEQWFVNSLMGKITNGEIYKPKVQRKKKWEILPKKGNKPNEKSYIQFLYSKHNSVHSITFGQINDRFSNIDGNNRINAIAHFLKEPFSLFPEYLENINTFIDAYFEDADVNKKIKCLIQNINYNNLMTFKYNKYFEQIGEKPFYDANLKTNDKRDDFEPYFDELIEKLKIQKQGRFDERVKINVTLFEGYTTEELNALFGEINRYDNKLSEIELLACRLSSIDNFEIEDVVLKAEVIKNVKEFYENKNEGEILNCYTFDENLDKLNAYDFIVGFQNYANKKCEFINETDSDGLSLFFKVFKVMFKTSFDIAFTNENINKFIVMMKKTIDILISVSNIIFMENLVSGYKMFDVCNKKLNSLKKNNTYLIIAAIIGYIEKGENESVILRSIEKCILFHFFIYDISDDEKKEEFKLLDGIRFEAGGAYIDNVADAYYKNPSQISEKIKEEKMITLLDILIKENIKNKKYETRKSGKDKIDKRRSRKFYEKALIYYYYKTKIPTEFLKYNFWVEHICPFSSQWDDEIDKDRLGNILPIIDKLNSLRSNKHISEYKKYDNYGFLPYVSDIIPDNNMYDEIMNHSEDKPYIESSSNYNILCDKNEKIYRETIIKHLF